MSTENQENKEIVDPHEELLAESGEVQSDDAAAAISDLEVKLTEANDKYVRLSAEFDNYRKRTLKEKYDLIKNAGEDIVRAMLPVLDDFDRGIEMMEKTDSIDAVREGLKLIHAKLLSLLQQQGLTEIPALDCELDTDLHDAVTTTPVEDEKKKGKIVDVVQKGYKLNEKVVRHSKVVIGE